MSTVTIRRAEERDLDSIAVINAGVFLGDRDDVASAREWIGCWFRSFPLYQYFVAEKEARVVGYSGWQLHGGFRRADPAIELDQIGIHPDEQKSGIGQELIRYSQRVLIDWTVARNTRIESHITFVVWAYSLNFNAINAYVKTFGQSISGFRAQFGDRAESMIRHRVPIILPIRE